MAFKEYLPFLANSGASVLLDCLLLTISRAHEAKTAWMMSCASGPLQGLLAQSLIWIDPHASPHVQPLTVHLFPPQRHQNHIKTPHFELLVATSCMAGHAVHVEDRLTIHQVSAARRCGAQTSR